MNDSDKILKTAVRATKTLCDELGIEQTMDNLSSLIEPKPVPYLGVDIDKLVDELMANDSRLSRDDAFQIAYKQVESDG